MVGSGLQVSTISEPADLEFVPGKVECLDLNLLPADLPFGQVSAAAGHAAFMYLKKSD